MLLLRLRTWQLGIKSLLLHPLRSLLTVLGIFIGVASVIWLLAIGEGISVKAQEQIAGLGADNIIIRSVQPTNQSSSSFMVDPYGLTRDDFRRLKETIPSVKRAIPIRELRREFRYRGNLVDGRLVGCTAEYLDLNHLLVARGHFVTDADCATKANVCVLAAEVAQRLFPAVDPLGETIRVDKEYYKVVGVLQPREAMAGIGGSLAAQDFNTDVYIPIDTLWARIGDRVVTRRGGTFQVEALQLSQVTLRVASPDFVMQTADAVRTALESNHPKADFAVVVPMELLEQARNTRLMFIAMMGLIAAISLVVGGIGIMNIMLATVTERTREIGIRRALGARRGDITHQFLVETVVLSVVGGLTGILGGLTCGPVVTAVRWTVASAFPATFASMPDVMKSVSPIVVPWSIPLAFGISVVVGVVFGLYPANRAAAMNPIEALRHVA